MLRLLFCVADGISYIKLMHNLYKLMGNFNLDLFGLLSNNRFLNGVFEK